MAAGSFPIDKTHEYRGHIMASESWAAYRRNRARSNRRGCSPALPWPCWVNRPAGRLSGLDQKIPHLAGVVVPRSADRRDQDVNLASDHRAATELARKRDILCVRAGSLSALVSRCWSSS
jgi:hypothetical protein